MLLIIIVLFFEKQYTHKLSYLPLTHVQQRSPVAGGPSQFALEKFAVEEAPWAAVFPRQRLATHIIDKECCVNASHEQRGQLYPAGIHLLHLDAKQKHITVALCKNLEMRSYKLRGEGQVKFDYQQQKRITTAQLSN